MDVFIEKELMELRYEFKHIEEKGKEKPVANVS